MEVYYPMIKSASGMFLFLGVELSVLFFVISAAVSLVQQYVPQSKIQYFLSGKGSKGYLIAAALGAITPFCSCSTIPMLRGLLKAKAGFGPTLTFLFSSPLLNPIIIGLFVVTFGIKVTLIYVAIALVVSIAAGVILQTMGYERFIIADNATATSGCGCSCAPEPEPVKPATTCCATVPPESSSCCGTVPKPAESSSFKSKLKLSFREAAVQLKDVAPYLFIGVLLGAVIYGFIPSEFIAKHAGADNMFAVPIAAVIGIPLYVRAEALIPISAALVGKGMGLGAVMALIIGGSGASITEVILLKSMFRMPMMVAFLVVIIGMAIFAGYFFQFIF